MGDSYNIIYKRQRHDIPENEEEPLDPCEFCCFWLIQKFRALWQKIKAFFERHKYEQLR